MQAELWYVVLLSFFFLIMVNLIAWNCQGVGNRSSRLELKEVVKKHSVDMVALLEPKMSGVGADKIINGCGFTDWVRVEAEGFSGGIWVLWTNSTLDVEIIESQAQFIHLKIWNKEWYLTFFYGSPCEAAQPLLWRDLCRIEEGMRK